MLNLKKANSEIESRGERSRWLSKRRLSSPPLTNTSKIQLHVKLTWVLAEQLFYN